MTKGTRPDGLFTPPALTPDAAFQPRHGALMKHILRNRHGSLRNGWWILAFLVLFVASQPVYKLVSRALHQQGLEGAWLSPLPVVFLILVTYACLRLRGESLSAVGLRADLAWVREAFLGAAFGIAL